MAPIFWDSRWLKEGKPISHGWAIVLMVTAIAALFLIGYIIILAGHTPFWGRLRNRSRHSQPPNYTVGLSSITTDISPDIYTQRRQTFYRRQAQLREKKLARAATAPPLDTATASSPRSGPYAQQIDVPSQESLPAYAGWEDIPLRPLSPKSSVRRAMTDPFQDSKPRWTGNGWYVGADMVGSEDSSAVAVTGQGQRGGTRAETSYGAGGERKRFT